MHWPLWIAYALIIGVRNQGVAGVDSMQESGIVIKRYLPISFGFALDKA